MKAGRKEPYDEALSEIPTTRVRPASVPRFGSIQRVLLNLAALVVIVAGMRAAAPVLVLLLLSIFIAVVITPVFLGMQKRGIPSFIALLILILAMVLMGTVGASALAQSIDSFTSNLPVYQQRLGEQMGTVLSWLDAHGVGLPDQSIRETMRSPEGMRIVGNTLAALSGLAGRAFIIILVALFILFEAALLPRKIEAMPNIAPGTLDRLREVVINLRQYMWMKTLMSLLTGALVAFMLFLFGIDYAILLGVLAFGLNYVPNIGSFIAGLPGVGLAFIQFGFGTAAAIAVLYVVVNVLVSNVIEPRFMGGGLGLSPMIIVISLILWGWILGPIGMLLAVPLTMAFKIAFQGFEDTRWIAVLMGPVVPDDNRAA